MASLWALRHTHGASARKPCGDELHNHADGQRVARVLRNPTLELASTTVWLCSSTAAVLRMCNLTSACPAWRPRTYDGAWGNSIEPFFWGRSFSSPFCLVLQFVQPLQLTHETECLTAPPSVTGPLHTDSAVWRPRSRITGAAVSEKNVPRT